MYGSEIEKLNIECSNYGQRSSVVEEMRSMDAYLRSSKGMYCEECSKAGKRIFSHHVQRINGKMKSLCNTCYKRQELKRRLNG